MPLSAGFRAMLDTTVSWVQRNGTDQWGNESYSSPKDIPCFITGQNTTFGTDEAGNQQHNITVTNVEVITDAEGISPRDKFVLGDRTFYVSDVDTPKDAVGVDLMHTVRASSVEKG